MKQFTYGEYRIDVIPCDMDLARKSLQQWKDSNPGPKPPMVKPEYTFELAQKVNKLLKAKPHMSRKEAKQIVMDDQELVEDLKDGDFVEKKKLYDSQLWVVMEQFFWKHCTLLDQRHIVAMIWASGAEARMSFFKFVLSISEITAENVRAAVAKRGILWDGRPIYEVADQMLKKGWVVMPYNTMAELAAKESGVATHEYGKLDIPTRVDILAVWLCDRLPTALNQEIQRQQLEAKRKNGRGTANRRI